MKFLTPDELADMLKLPRRTVMDTVTKQKGFPPSLTGNRTPRWSADAVLEYFGAKAKPEQ